MSIDEGQLRSLIAEWWIDADQPGGTSAGEVLIALEGMLDAQRCSNPACRDGLIPRGDEVPPGVKCPMCNGGQVRRASCAGCVDRVCGACAPGLGDEGNAYARALLREPR